MCSVAASMATLMFNKYFRAAVNGYFAGKVMDEYQKIMCAALDKGAMFDARCFNIPKEDATNCFIWRQQDATRNAIQMLGQTYFTHKELQGKSCNDIQDMLMLQKGINFNDMPIEFKRGVCCFKAPGGWVLDTEIPIFTQERDYVDRWVSEQTLD
jgi:tRNA(His) 5'-end guanylyltransferase